MPTGQYLRKPLSEETKQKISIAHRKEWLEIICIVCKKNFKITPCRKDKAKYCSRVCLGKARVPYERTEEVKKKLHLSMAGKSRPHTAGDQSPCWISDRTQIKGYLTTRANSEYRRWRKTILKRDGSMCVWCGDEKSIEVDHILPWHLFPKLRYDPLNGQVLCNSCHRVKTFSERKNTGVLTFNY